MCSLTPTLSALGGEGVKGINASGFSKETKIEKRLSPPKAERGWGEALADKKAIYIFLLFFLIFFKASAQDLNYAHQIVDTLTSPYMSGRGYVNNGNEKAAAYIVSQFKSFSLKSFTKKYVQKFQFSVNTFPGQVGIKINEIALSPGKDYLIDPSSGSLKGTFEIVYVTKETIENPDSNRQFKQDDFANKILVIDRKEIDNAKIAEEFKAFRLNNYKAKAIVFLEDKKLTWSVSQMAYSYPVVTIMRSAFPKDAKTISFDIETIFIKKYATKNLIGYVKGTEKPDSFIVFSGHYDHLGKMGSDTYFPGANDNASGIAMLLNLSEYFSTHPQKYSIAFIAFAGEEAGLVGSKYYTEHPLFPLSKIKFLLNMDLMGTGDEGLMVVNGAIYEKEFKWLVNRNEEKKYLTQIKKRGKAANSDHYYFSEKGVPSFFFYTLGGISAYHDIYDKKETLPLTKFEQLFKLIVDFTKECF